jgi:hypothetical protein
MPHALMTWLQLILKSLLDWNPYSKDGALVMLPTSSKMRRKRRKDFNKIASRNVSDIFTVVDRNFYLHNGPYWRKCSLNDCTIFHFLEIMRFREHFAATNYVHFGCHFLTGNLKHTLFELSIYDRKCLMYTVFCLSVSVGTSLNQLFLLGMSDWNSLRYSLFSCYIHGKKNSTWATLPLISSSEI